VALPVRLSPGSESMRYLYVRAHRAERGGDEAATEAASRTLFVACVPIGCALWRALRAGGCSDAAPARSYGLSGLRELLSRFGEVAACTEVLLSSLPAPGAHVVFAHPRSVRRALAAGQPGCEALEPPPAESCEAHGLARWVADHRAERPGLAELQRQVDAWVGAHEAAQAAQAAQGAAAAAGDDGWTVVGAKRGRAKTVDQAGTTSVGGVAPKRAQRQKLAALPLPTHPDFYRFQKRDAQREQVLQLRAKFEQDKQRIVDLRKNRAFKPA